MENAKCTNGVEMATATTITTTAAVIGMAETAAGKRPNSCTARIAVAKTRPTRALPAANHAMNLPGKETKRVMMKTTTAVALGTVATAVAPPKNTTTFTAKSASVWTRKTSQS